MRPITLGGSAMRECETCGGLWLEVVAFEKICADREHQAAVLGLASSVTGHRVDPTSEKIKVRYFPCPQCEQLMNRMNFARCSGVIVDVCRGHGTWFDRDELRAIIEFIRGGGLQLSRQKEKFEIESERKQLRYEQSITNKSAEGFSFSDEERLLGISSTGHLLEFLIDGE